ncbi:hypothetical protein PSYPI_39909, partial [Pseudomonas syringae pv. pisi str. 1704B]
DEAVNFIAFKWAEMIQGRLEKSLQVIVFRINE